MSARGRDSDSVSSEEESGETEHARFKLCGGAGLDPSGLVGLAKWLWM
jgi:hypothetical protein